MRTNLGLLDVGSTWLPFPPEVAEKHPNRSLVGEESFSDVGLPLYGVLKRSAIAGACKGRRPKLRRGSGHGRVGLVSLAS